MSSGDASEKFLDDIHRLRECLEGTFFLDRLKMPELEKLMSAMKKQHFPAGSTIFKQGDKGETFYLVSKGLLSFWVRKGLVDKKVAPVEFKQIEFPIPIYHPDDLRLDHGMVVYEKLKQV